MGWAAANLRMSLDLACPMAVVIVAVSLIGWLVYRLVVESREGSDND